MRNPGLKTFINFEDYKNYMLSTSLNGKKTDLMIRKHIKVFVYLKNDTTAWRVTSANENNFSNAISRLRQLPHSGATTETSNSNTVILYAFLKDITNEVNRRLKDKDFINEIEKDYPSSEYGYFVFVSNEIDPQKAKQYNVNLNNLLNKEKNTLTAYLQLNFSNNYLYNKEGVSLLNYEPDNINSISLSVSYLAITKTIPITDKAAPEDLSEKVKKVLADHPNWNFFVLNNQIVFGMDITALVHSEMINEKNADVNQILDTLSSKIKTLIGSNTYQILYVYPNKLANDNFFNEAVYLQNEYLNGDSLPNDPLSHITTSKSDKNTSKKNTSEENKPIQTYTQISTLGSSISITTTDIYNKPPPFYRRYITGGVTTPYNDIVFEKNGLWYVKHTNLISIPIGCSNGMEFASVIRGGEKIATCSSVSHLDDSPSPKKPKQPPPPYHPPPVRCNLNIRVLPFRRVAIALSSNYNDKTSTYIIVDNKYVFEQRNFIVLAFHEDGKHNVKGLVFNQFGSCQNFKYFYVSEQRIEGDVVVSDVDLFNDYYINIFPTKDMALDNNYVIFSADDNSDEDEGGI